MKGFFGLLLVAVLIGAVVGACHGSNTYTDNGGSVSGNTDINAPQCQDFIASQNEALNAGGYDNMTGYQQSLYDSALHKCRGN